MPIRAAFSRQRESICGETSASVVAMPRRASSSETLPVPPQASRTRGAARRSAGIAAIARSSSSSRSRRTPAWAMQCSEWSYSPASSA
jgi:hypothetical protein